MELVVNGACEQWSLWSNHGLRSSNLVTCHRGGTAMSPSRVSPEKRRRKDNELCQATMWRYENFDNH